MFLWLFKGVSVQLQYADLLVIQKIQFWFTLVSTNELWAGKFKFSWIASKSTNRETFKENMNFKTFVISSNILRRSHFFLSWQKHNELLQFQIRVRILVCQVQNGWLFEIFVAFSANMNWTIYQLAITQPNILEIFNKVHIFCEGHKIYLRNLHLTFDLHYILVHRTKARWRFRKILWPSQNIWTLTNA